MMPWIKILSNINDHPKIKLIRQSSKGDSLALLWILLLTEAGKCCRRGRLLISEDNPYTEETLSRFLGFRLSVVQSGLKLFYDLSMIELIDKTICIKNWSKYQADLGKLEERRRNDRLRQQACRKNKGDRDPADCQAMSRDDQIASSCEVTKEIRTEKNITRNTTTNNISELLSDSPFEKLSDSEFECLAKRHGRDRLLLVLDYAVEEWRKEHKEIKNPGGYLHSLCENFVAPEWYVSFGEREERAANIQRLKKERVANLAAMQAAEDAEHQVREELWGSLLKDEKVHYRELALADLPAGSMPPDSLVLLLAKQKAWRLANATA